MLRLFRLSFAAVGILLASSAYAADVTVTGVHHCCPNCEKAMTAALTGAGATNIKVDGTKVSFSATDATEADKAAKALYDAGFAGKVDGARPRAQTGARGVKGKEIAVEGAHNCCGSCVKAINEGVKAVGTTNVKARDTSFTVTGENEIEATAVVRALRASGFNAHVKK